MKAVQFGAGNIGRGFMGQLYFETRFDNTFVEMVADIVNGMNGRGGYPLRIVSEESETLTILGVRAIHGTDVERAANALAEADLAVTAVGANVLPPIAPTIARALEFRFGGAAPRSLNIIVCENLVDAGPFLRRGAKTPVGRISRSAGFRGGLHWAHWAGYDRCLAREEPLRVCVEAYCELLVDANGFRGPVPKLNDMAPFCGQTERRCRSLPEMPMRESSTRAPAFLSPRS